MHPCKNCVDNNLKCTLCVEGTNRSITTPTCGCNDGYYNVGT